MKLERKALLWMPATNRRKKNQEMKKTPNTKEKKERTRKEKETKSLKELITFPLPQKKKPPPKKNQARHTSSWRSSSLGRFRLVSCYFGSRFLDMQRGRIILLSIEEASVLI